MACFVLCAAILKNQQTASAEVEIPGLEVNDSRDDYTTSDGDGVWIREYVAFMEKVVRKRCALPNFAFVDDHKIDEDLFDEIPSPHVRMLLIEFTNAIYPDWMIDGVDCPCYEEIRDGARTYCDDCEHAYEEILGTYDGDLPEDVEDDEDLEDPSITEPERNARMKRNAERQAERMRRQEAKDEAESEVVDREWVCRDDCDGFLDFVDERAREETTVDTELLESRWESFLADRNERDFPPLIVELARRS